MPDVVLTTGADNSGLKAGMAELRGIAAQAHQDISSEFGRSIAVGGIVAAIGEVTKSTVEYGARVYDLGQRFGVSTDALQRFGNAAEKNGSSLEGVAQGFNKLLIAQSKAIGGNQELIDHFANLNISVNDLKTLSPDEIMLKLGKSSMNAADTVAILGRNGLQLRPVLQGLADGTIEFGAAINELNVERLKEIDDQMKEIGEEAKVGASYMIVWAAAIAKAIVGIPNLPKPPKPPRQQPGDDESPPAGGGGIGSGGGAGGASLDDRLSKLQRDDYLSQLDSLEKIKAVDQEIADLEAELNRGRKDGTLSLDEDERLQVQILEKEGEITKTKEEQDQAQSRYNAKVQEARQAAEDETQAAERRNQVLQLTIAGHADIAAHLQEQWKLEDQISDVTGRINEAWSEGDQTLAEQLTALRDQLQVQGQLVEASARRLANEQAIADGIRNATQGFGAYAGTNNILNAIAGNVSIGGDPNVSAATRPDGTIDQAKLKDLQDKYQREIDEWIARGFQGSFPSFPGGSGAAANNEAQRQAQAAMNALRQAALNRLAAAAGRGGSTGGILGQGPQGGQSVGGLPTGGGQVPSIDTGGLTSAVGNSNTLLGKAVDLLSQISAKTSAPLG